MGARATVTPPATTGAGIGGLGHIPALDGLRAIAVAAVLAYHGGISVAGGGFLGVSVFFTLSGFLITSLMVREWHEHDRLDLRRFWSRRFRRLLPASWLTIGLVLAVGALGVWDTSQLRSLRGDVPWSLAELVNWHFIAQGTQYGADLTLPSPLQHFWSLAVEQQFYVLLPLLVVATLGAARRWLPGSPVAWLAGVLVVLAIGSSVANGVLAQGSVDRAYFGTDTRAAEMLVGALLGLATFRRLRLGGAARALSVGAGAAGLAVVLVLFGVAAVPDAWLYPWGLLGCAAATAALVLGAAQASVFGAVLSWAPLVGLGRISYGVYLLHWPVFLVLTPERTGWDGPLLFVARTVCSIVPAVAMFSLLERPVRTGRLLRPATARVVVPAAVVVLLAGDAVVTRDLPPPPGYLQPRDVTDVRVREPAGTTLPPPTQPSAPPTTTAPPGTDEPARPPTTTTVPPVRAQRVLLVGDSVAASLEDALGDTLVAFGTGYASAAAPGCGVITGFPTDEQGRVAEMTRACNRAVPERQLNAVAEVEPDLVVVLSSWEMTNREVDGTWYPFGAPASDEMLRRLYGEAIDRLSARGAAVALTLLPDIVDGRVEQVRPEEVVRSRHLNRILQQVATERQGVTTLPLDAVVCPGDPCPRVVDGRELRAEDGRHFDDPAAARWVAQRWTEQILGVDLATI